MLNSILRRGENIIKIRHTASAHGKLSKLREAFEKAYAQSGEMFQRAQAEMMSWGRMSITDEAVDRFLKSMFPVDAEGNWKSTRTRNNVDRWMDAYQNAPGADAGSVWGLAQGITNWATHGINLRGDTSRMDSVYLGSGARWESAGMNWLRGYVDEEETRAQQHVQVVVG